MKDQIQIQKFTSIAMALRQPPSNEDLNEKLRKHPLQKVKERDCWRYLRRGVS